MTHQGMMGRQLVTHHQQVSALMDKLMQSMAAIQSEKDPAALKSKLAEHATEGMHDQMVRQGNMMSRHGRANKTELPGRS